MTRTPAVLPSVLLAAALAASPAATQPAAPAPPSAAAPRPAMRPDTILYGAAYYHEYMPY